MAYSDPWHSPLSHLLDPMQREPVCASLNCALLGMFDWTLYFKVESFTHWFLIKISLNSLEILPKL